MVVYIQDSVVLAAGHVQPMRNTLHGKNIPSHHVCVLLTTAQANVRAPFLSGDPEENAFLEKGKFFSLPKNYLYTASLQNNSLHLMPYTS